MRNKKILASNIRCNLRD